MVFGRKNKEVPRQLADMPDAPVGMFKDPAQEFAEIYGSAMVGQNRMFVLAGLLGVVTLFAVAAMFSLASKSTAVPWLVEVNNDGGVLSRPVKIENIQPNQAVIKSELAKFIVNIFTLDKALSPRYFVDANVMTSGLGTTKFANFRTSENVAQRLAKEPDMTRFASVTSVDISQRGIAFVFVSTQETRGALTGIAPAKWRVTLKYELTSPKTEEEILKNPLGLFVTDLNITQESKQ